MKNCLGDGHYAGKMVRGEVFIAFIRKATRPNVSFVAVEYDLRQKRVSQCYGANNSKPPKPVLQFVNRLFSKSLTKGLHK